VLDYFVARRFRMQVLGVVKLNKHRSRHIFDCSKLRAFSSTLLQITIQGDSLGRGREFITMNHAVIGR
jgi:hypothetical protein